MAFHPESPLYERDVERLDRQDDNAATRLFSSGSLQHLIDKHSNALGEIVYLFIFGELIDAYQNREISLSERFIMAMRAFYFLTMWELFLEKAGFKRSIFFISREAADICRILIEGIIALIFVYRDYYSTPTLYPLLPWLHSTEACEHTFGSARQIVKDFTMLDFYRMIQKLRFKIREAVLLTEASSPKATASGYNHTYLLSGNVDLLALATHFSNDEIPGLVKTAMQEADSVVSLLGLSPLSLRSNSYATIQLPSITSWFDCEAESVTTRSDDYDDLFDQEEAWEDSDDTDVPRELMSIIQNPSLDDWSQGLSAKGKSRLSNLLSASAALAIDNMITA